MTIEAKEFELPELSGDFRSSSSRIVPQAAIMLALAVPMSSSSARPEDCWARVFDQSSSVYNSPFSEKPTARIEVQDVLPVTAELLAAVQSFFGLSKTQLAQVCRVQRQTIYDWYAGSFEAEGDNARRLTRLYNLAEGLRSEGREPLSTRVVRRALSSGNTLLDLLAGDDVRLVEVAGVVAQLDQATSERRTRSAAAARERLGWGPTTEEAAARNLEANLEDVADG